MRQLDLFGSFTEVSPPQNDVREKPVDSEKEAEKPISTYNDHVVPQFSSLFDHSFSEKNLNDFIESNEAVSTDNQIARPLIGDEEDIKQTVELLPAAIEEETGILDVADEPGIISPVVELAEVTKK